MLPPIGGSNELTRQEWLKRELAKVPSGSTLLDAGAGELKNKRHCEHLVYISQDICEYDGIGTGTALQTGSWDTSAIDIVCDISALSLESSTIDAVLCSEVLEHVPDPVSVLQELARVLKPGGTLTLTAPFCSLTHFSPYHYSTGFSRYWYEHHLSRMGLSVSKIETNGNYFEYLAQEFRRLGSVSGAYSKPRTALYFLLIFPVLWLLRKYSRSDTGSSQLLCFGYNVVAKKWLPYCFRVTHPQDWLDYINQYKITAWSRWVAGWLWANILRHEFKPKWINLLQSNKTGYQARRFCALGALTILPAASGSLSDVNHDTQISMLYLAPSCRTC